MSNKDIGLIIVTVIMVGVLIGGFIYDRNEELLDRTNNFLIAEDENLEIVKVEKAGFLYSRTAYEAKLKIVDGYWESYYLGIANIYDNDGQILTPTQYHDYASEALTAVAIKPEPASTSAIWVMGTTLTADKPAMTIQTSETSAGSSDSLVLGGTATTAEATSTPTPTPSADNDDDTGPNVVYIIDQEDDGCAYLYIYYSKY